MVGGVYCRLHNGVLSESMELLQKRKQSNRYDGQLLPLELSRPPDQLEAADAADTKRYHGPVPRSFLR